MTIIRELHTRLSRLTWREKVRNVGNDHRSPIPSAGHYERRLFKNLVIAVHCMAALPTTKMAHQHGASREEIAETVALARWAAVYGGGALRAYDQFVGKSYNTKRRASGAADGTQGR
jgi:hypothetical protein